jgi:hypothetical protein
MLFVFAGNSPSIHQIQWLYQTQTQAYRLLPRNCFDTLEQRTSKLCSRSP